MGGIVMWIARDRNNLLHVFQCIPYKDEESGCWKSDCHYQTRILPNWFPEVKWEDEEPRELILK